MMLQSSRYKAASAVEVRGSTTPKSCHRQPNFLPPLAQRRHRRRIHTTKKLPTGGSVSTHSTSYLSSDSETDTTISSVTVGRHQKEPLPRNVGVLTARVCKNDWVGYGIGKERVPLQYSDDEEGSDDDDDDDSLEFLDQLLNESSGRWKNETGQIISSTATARGPCGHMLSASSGAPTKLGM